ncbi:MAG: PQQ-binding-like beta-propeller repeat protein, partial [Myxococcales bacterium]|nr:PQQ-binding-like beta-propeller repeat protein [Myxococcales bacterium]
APGAGARPAVELGTGVALRLERVARAAVAVPGAVVTLAPDFRALEAFDPASGAERWRTALEGEPSGEHALAFTDGEIVVKAGNRLFIVDPASGAVRRRRLETPYCPFVAEAGACAFDCGCAAFVVDCQSLADVTFLRGAEIHLYHDLAEPHDTVCGFAPRVLGRFGPRIVATVPDGGGVGLHSDGVVVVLDAATGKELRRGATVRRYDTRAGVAAGGGCWVAEESAATLTLTDCATGAPRWQASIGVPGDANGLDVRTLAGGDLFVRRLTDAGSELARISPGKGDVRWRRLAQGAVGVLEDEDPRAVYGASLPSYELVASADGRSLARITLAEREQLRRDPGRGGFVAVGGGSYRELDGSGAEVRRLAFEAQGSVREVRPSHLVTETGGPDSVVRVLRRTDLAPVATLTGPLSVLDAGPLGGRFVLVERFRPDGAIDVLALEVVPAA